MWIELRWLRFILVLSQNGDLFSQLNNFRGVLPLEGIAIKFSEVNGTNVFCHTNESSLFIVPRVEKFKHAFFLHPKVL